MAGGGGVARRALRHRDFRVLLAAIAVSGTGDWLYSVAIVVYIFDATGSPGWVAAVAFVRLLPYALLSGVAGELADRYNRRLLMVACDAARMVVMVVLGLAMMAEAPVLLVVGLATLSTIFATPYRPSSAALTPTIVGERDLAAANGVAETVENLALLAGPAIGGALLAVTPAYGAVFINAVTFAISGALVLMLRVQRAPTVADENEPGFRERLAAGVGALRASATALALVALVGAATLQYGAESVLWVVVAQERLGIGAEGFGYMMAAAGAGGLLGALLVGRIADHPRPGLVLVVSGVILATPLALLAAVTSPWVAYPLLVVEGVGTITMDVVVVTVMQRTVPNEVLGKVFGILDSIGAVGTLLGIALATVALWVLPLPVSLLVAAASVPLVVVLTRAQLAQVSEQAERRRRELADRVALLERLDIFEGAPATAVELVAAQATESTAAQGDIVLRAGDPADAFYVILDGTMAVTAAMEGETVVVNRMNAGDFFGEIGLLEHLPRTATVTATTPVRLLRVDGEAFLEALSAAPATAALLRSGVGRRLARTHPTHPVARAAKESPQ